jgi:hypothetical protein
MVINHQPQEPIKQALALAFGESVDVLYVMAKSENGFPSRDGVGAYYWVHGNQLFADIFGGASWLRVDFESVFGCGFVEFGLCVGRGQAFEELLDGRGDSIVDFVAGCPECVYSR